MTLLFCNYNYPKCFMCSRLLSCFCIDYIYISISQLFNFSPLHSLELKKKLNKLSFKIRHLKSLSDLLNMERYVMLTMYSYLRIQFFCIFRGFYFQMNGVTNGSDPGLALQGLTVQGSNNNPDNRPVEDPAQKRGKVLNCVCQSNLSTYIYWNLPSQTYSLGNILLVLVRNSENSKMGMKIKI